MKTDKVRIGESLLYFCIWAIIFGVPVLNSLMLSESVSIDAIFIAWFKIVPYFIIFLVHNSIFLPKYMFGKRYVSYLAMNILFILLIFIVVDYVQCNFAYIIDKYEDPKALERGSASFTDLSIAMNVWLGMVLSGANMGVKLVYKLIKEENQMESLKNQKLEAEMDYLKYQINPHFFMNTLNNIHALIDIDKVSAQKAIIDLSKMMRHVLYDSTRELISLSDEIAFIKNYIDLMRIRYSLKVSIEFNHPQLEDDTISIAPLLLIVFVENSFKHGINSRHNCFIKIDLDYDDEFLNFKIVNPILPLKKTPSLRKGIGLENVKKRLKLLYGSNYLFKIEKDEEIFCLTLKIPVSHD